MFRKMLFKRLITVKDTANPGWPEFLMRVQGIFPKQMISRFFKGKRAVVGKSLAVHERAAGCPSMGDPDCDYNRTPFTPFLADRLPEDS